MPVKVRVPLLPCEQEAIALLEVAKIAGQVIGKPHIWRVDSEAILFTRGGEDGDPFTAWTDGAVGKKTILRIDDGFVAEY